MKVFIGLGSNVGDRESNIRSALEHLPQQGVSIIKVSSLYETTAVGPPQPDFINAVATGETSHQPRELIRVLKEIEATVGRRPRERWGPREIDLDLLLYGELTVTEADLIVPHPELTKRNFVLVPLLEIEPDATLPSGKRVSNYLTDQPEGVRKLS